MMEVHVVSRTRGSVSPGGQTGAHAGLDHTCLCLDDWAPSEYDIRQRAYEISLTRPGAWPDPQLDWLLAKTELVARRILGLT